MKRRRQWIALLLCPVLLLSGCAAGSSLKSGAADDVPDAALAEEAKKSAEEGKSLLANGGPAVPEAAGEPEMAADAGAGAPGSDDAGIVLNYKDDPVKTGEWDGVPAEPIDGTPGEGETDTLIPGQGLVLTAAEWNDNRNWPFFTNLVSSGRIRFPSFGIDPRQRVPVQLTDADGSPLANECVQLLDGEDTVLWTARSDKDGNAYLFFGPNQRPSRVVCGDKEAPVPLTQARSDTQSHISVQIVEPIQLTVEQSAPAAEELQVMFIVDTTGSMGDELAYLQKDFSAIAHRVGSDGVRYAVSFYRDEGDEYVTRHNEFTSDVAQVQAQLNAEFAGGGGDTPEAVAEVLTECLKERSDWAENSVKLAFLIFDAPPHEGKEETLQAAVQAAAAKGIHLIPVVASNAERETELFGRALAICTNGSYVFLTDDSGVGESHLEPIVGNYEVEKLQDLIVRIIEQSR